MLVPGKRRGSTDFHTPHACAHAKASAPPEQQNPNLLVHEAASARRILHRLLSPRPGFLTPFIIASPAEQLLRRPHHRPRLLPSSPSPPPQPAAAGSADLSITSAAIRRRHFLPNAPLNFNPPQLKQLYQRDTDFCCPPFTQQQLPNSRIEKDQST